MIVDTHCHIDSQEFKENLFDVVERAKEAGIDCLINPGCCLRSSEAAIKLAQKIDILYPAVGVHPLDIHKEDNNFLCNIKKLITREKVIAIGEIGLDYYYNSSYKDHQIKYFIQQAELAEEFNLPILVHTREAFKDMISLLKNKKFKIPVILHAFSGDEEDAKILQELDNVFISISGTITYGNKRLENILKEVIEFDKFLVETDAPYLTPYPIKKQRQRNEPAFIVHTIKKVAEILDLSFEDIVRINRANTWQIFGERLAQIKKPPPKLAYKIKNNLYINLTNRCTNDCVFCLKKKTYFVGGHNLLLYREPTAEEIINEIRKEEDYKELVFCGLGEPFLRQDVIFEVARYVKKTKPNIKVRINTNGSAFMFYNKKDEIMKKSEKDEIMKKLKETVDIICVSLNATNEEDYISLCRPQIENFEYKKIIDFIKAAKKAVSEVYLTFVDIPGRINKTDVEKLATQLSVKYKYRRYNHVGK